MLLGLFRWVTVASVLCLLAPATLQAQYPRARRGQFEVRGLGRVYVPVLPIAFRNVAPPFPASQYDDLLFTALPTGRPYNLNTFLVSLTGLTLLGG